MNFPVKVDGLEGLTLPDRPLHLAAGMFDGVHRGHQSVIQAAIATARKTGGIAGVLTFWPHPSAIFRPQEPVPQIMPPEVKVRVLRSLGVDLIIEQPFTPAFASIPAEEFVRHLKGKLPQLASIYVGDNWRFGKGRRGDVTLLKQLGREQNIDVVSAPRLTHTGEPISSTRIRHLLAEGEIATANSLLGYNYFTQAAVQEGKQLGRTLGFPTLNLPWSPPLEPRFGVYAIQASHPEAKNQPPIPGVANYGIRPTVNEASATKAPLLEVFLFTDTCPFTTGDEVLVEWVDFLRPEQRFADLEDLKAQIARDIVKARGVLKV